MATLSDDAANAALDALITAFAGDILVGPLRVTPSAAYLGTGVPSFAAASSGVKSLATPLLITVVNPGTVAAVDLRNTPGTMVIRVLVGTTPDTAVFTAGVVAAVAGQVIRFNAIDLYMS